MTRAPVLGLVLALGAGATIAAEQAPAVTVRIVVRSADAPVEGATVSAADATVVTDPQGRASLAVSPGQVTVLVTKDRFVASTTTAVVTAAADQVITIELTAQPVVEEEVVVVASTRTGRRVDDEPTRVEVLGREEIEEKMLMTPGDIVMMLNEMGGLRVQATSPSLGAASVRIQGMRGRYTRLLSDGLPLFGEQPGGLGLLQIPPMDLGQVEVIKGVASALYGAGAMGGVVNLLSRRPGQEPEHEVLLNRSTRGGTDGVLWLATPLSDRWGVTLLGSGHWQEQRDVDDDGWSDLPGYRRAVVRPRLFWDNHAGRSFFATTGVTVENRTGGTTSGRTLPVTGASFRESLETRNVDVGAIGQMLLGNRYVMIVRGAFARQAHDHQFGENRERDRHRTGFAELTVRGTAGPHTWVGGFAIEHSQYQPLDRPQFAFSSTTPGGFVQDDITIQQWLTISVSGRADHHSDYGWFVSPRASALVRAGAWTSRLSVGTGFFAPTPLTEETEAAGLSKLTITEPLRPERGRGLSVDLTRTFGPASVTATAFASRVRDPLHVDRESYSLGNLTSPTTTIGMELLTTMHAAPFSLTGTYTYVRARERLANVPADVALTPRHSVGVVGMVESEDAGRVGLEIYVTGRQQLDVNPHRTASEPYVIVGLLAERRFGRVRLFINGENLTGVRQSRWNPLLRPTRAVDGRWTVDAWAPLEGRTLNGGMRVGF